MGERSCPSFEMVAGELEPGPFDREFGPSTAELQRGGGGLSRALCASVVVHFGELTLELES